jgi:hypothetical protein
MAQSLVRLSTHAVYSKTKGASLDARATRYFIRPAISVAKKNRFHGSGSTSPTTTNRIASDCVFFVRVGVDVLVNVVVIGFLLDGRFAALWGLSS